MAKLLFALEQAEVSPESSTMRSWIKVVLSNPSVRTLRRGLNQYGY